MDLSQVQKNLIEGIKRSGSEKENFDHNTVAFGHSGSGSGSGSSFGCWSGSGSGGKYKNLFRMDRNRNRKWNRWKLAKFQCPPVFSLCDLIVRHKLENRRNPVYRSESFHYMEKNQFIPHGETGENRAGARFNESNIDVNETYAEPLDALSSPESAEPDLDQDLWTHQLIVPGREFPNPKLPTLPQGLQLLSTLDLYSRSELKLIKEPSYHENQIEIDSKTKSTKDCFLSLHHQLPDNENTPIYTEFSRILIQDFHDDGPNYVSVNKNSDVNDDSRIIRRGGHNLSLPLPGLRIGRDLDARVIPFRTCKNSTIPAPASRLITRVTPNSRDPRILDLEIPGIPRIPDPDSQISSDNFCGTNSNSNCTFKSTSSYNYSTIPSSSTEPFHTNSRKSGKSSRARDCKNKYNTNKNKRFRKGQSQISVRESVRVDIDSNNNLNKLSPLFHKSIVSFPHVHLANPNPPEYVKLTESEDCHYFTNLCSLSSSSSSSSSSCSCSRHCHCSMARKRYETAFLPSSSSTSDANLQSPDVDSLLLAIEGTSLTEVTDHRHHITQITQSHHQLSHELDHQSLIMKHHRQLYNESDDDHDHDPTILSSRHSHTQVSAQNSRTTSPSPYQFQFQEVHVHHHQNQNRGYSSSNSNSSSPQRHSSSFRLESRGNFSETEESQSNSLCSPRKFMSPNPNLPLSEPLPVKRWSNVTSRGSSQSHGHGPSDKRSLMKDNSISSLESLDSTKSDDLQLLRQNFSFSRQQAAGHAYGQSPSPSQGQGGHYGHSHGKTAKSKLLSPISDKSPLEPKSLSQLQSVGIDYVNSSKMVQDPNDIDSDIHSSTVQGKARESVCQSSTLNSWDWSNQNILSAAELTNVPWEMPKLRRKLALMADSGISLDLPPPPAPILEVGNFTSRNRRVSSDFFSRPKSQNQGQGQFGAALDEDLALASTSTSSSFQNSNSKIGIPIPPLAKCENFSLKKVVPEGPGSGKIGNVSGGSNSNTGNSNDSQLEKRGNLDLKLPLRRGNEDDDNYLGGDYYGNENEIRENYLPSSNKPDRYRVWLDFHGGRNPVKIEFDPTIELESQDWFYGAITRSEAEDVLRPTKEGSFLVRNCESSNFNQYSLSLKCARGFIHIRIEPNSLGTFSLGDQQFPSVPHLVLHFMTHRLPIKGAEHVKLIYPVINQLL